MSPIPFYSIMFYQFKRTSYAYVVLKLDRVSEEKNNYNINITVSIFDVLGSGLHSVLTSQTLQQTIKCIVPFNLKFCFCLISSRFKNLLFHVVASVSSGQATVLQWKDLQSDFVIFLIYRVTCVFVCVVLSFNVCVSTISFTDRPTHSMKHAGRIRVAVLTKTNLLRNTG